MTHHFMNLKSVISESFFPTLPGGSRVCHVGLIFMSEHMTALNGERDSTVALMVSICLLNVLLFSEEHSITKDKGKPFDWQIPLQKRDNREPTQRKFQANVVKHFSGSFNSFVTLGSITFFLCADIGSCCCETVMQIQNAVLCANCFLCVMGLRVFGYNCFKVQVRKCISNSPFVIHLCSHFALFQRYEKYRLNDLSNGDSCLLVPQSKVECSFKGLADSVAFGFRQSLPRNIVVSELGFVQSMKEHKPVNAWLKVVRDTFSDPMTGIVDFLFSGSFNLFTLPSDQSRCQRSLGYERDNVKPGCLKAILCDVRAILRKGGGSVSEGLLFPTQRRAHITESVGVIGVNDYRRCASLCEVTFSKDSRVKCIAGFSDCVSLCRIEIPPSLEVITKSGFSGCTSLNEILFSVDSHLREIQGFQKCSSLCRIEIPPSVAIITESGFSGCTSLNEILFSVDSHLREIQGFRKCSSVYRIEIPPSVEIITKFGFSKCKSLNEILFSVDSHLREIHGFQKCSSLCRIQIPPSVEMIGESGFSDCKSLNQLLLSMDSHLREIQGFWQCSSLRRIEIPPSVEIIAEFGFSECKSLNEILFSVDSHLREIQGFQSCSSLCRIEIPPSVEIITEFGFYGCKSLNKVTFTPGGRVRVIKGFRRCNAFLVHQDNYFMKQNRRLLHLCSPDNCRAQKGIFRSTQST
jgi:metal-sulfur cluster biosynthetic enzyme